MFNDTRAALIIAALAIPTTPLAQARAPEAGKVVAQRDPEVRRESRRFTAHIPMGDGVQLATDVWLPREGRGPWPTVLRRTPYNRRVDNAEVDLTDAGFAVVVQDVRGKFASEGEYDAFLSDGWGDQQDGAETLAWIGAQPFSDGRVCLAGASASGISAYLGTGAQPPELACTFAQVATGDLYHVAIFQGGAFRQELVTGWLASTNALDMMELIEEEAVFSDFWDPLFLPEKAQAVRTPVYHRGGWFDPFLAGTLGAFEDLKASPGAEGQRLVVGPWTHIGQGELTQGELTFPASSRFDVWGEQRAFFAHHLKGEGDAAFEGPPVQIYLMGDGADPESPGNRWVGLQTWPPPSTPLSLYLGGDGQLVDTAPGEVLPSTFRYDPADPVPTLGGQNLMIAPGPYDQRPLEGRGDVLTYTSKPLKAPLVVAGEITAQLYVSSSAVDTDFTVKLTDVYPDGRSMLVTDGILRMRSREGADREVFMTAGEVYSVEVSLLSTALAFSKGHRIRVSVSSSNSPRFEPNPNTGAPFHEGDAVEVATQTLFHDGARPSRILLPVAAL